MAHGVVARAADPHPVPRGEHVSSVVDEAVVHHVSVRGPRLVARQKGLADANAARAQVVDVALHDAVVLASLPQPKRVHAHVRDLALLQRAPLRTVQQQRGILLESRALAVRRLALVEDPVRMLERQPPQCHVLNTQPEFRLALELNQPAQDRRDHVRLPRVFPGHRPVVEQARAAVQVPLARRIERRAMVLHCVALLLLPVAHGPAAARGKAGHAARFIHGRDPVQRRGPGVVHKDVHVAEAGPRLDVARLETEPHFGRRVAAGLASVGEGLDRAFGAQVPFVGRACTRAPGAVDEELMEVPLALARLRNVRDPERPFALAPARYATAP